MARRSLHNSQNEIIAQGNGFTGAVQNQPPSVPLPPTEPLGPGSVVATAERKTVKPSKKIKTPNNTTITTEEEVKKLPPKLRKSNIKNPLNYYRSYTYNFTLAALKKDSLENPESYRENNDYFVIARSGGKGTVGLLAPTSTKGLESANSIDAGQGPEESGSKFRALTTESDKLNNKIDLVNSFNKNSPGRFDFYIGNVEIETLMGFNEKTTLSVATKIQFDIFEPYSMSGFIEALHVSAIAAGHDQYISAIYLLKMEFLGYPDNEDLPNSAKIVPNSTRYFVFRFTGLDVTVTENGTKYSCNGVPFNEIGFGTPSTLKKPVQLVGSSVGEILKSFEAAINEEKADAARIERGDASKRDEYKIEIPFVDESGIVDGEDNGDIIESKVGELLKENSVFKFVDYKTKTGKVLGPVAFFAEGKRIHECIISIIRDSDYIRNIIKNFTNKEKKSDKSGLVDYFIVNLEVIQKDVVDDKTNKPFYIYKYIVLPYKIHYSRIPLLQNQKSIDTSELIRVANRSYDYLYTGANTDIINFDLKFNTLFFQAIPYTLGNKDGKFSAQLGIEPNGQSIQQLTRTGVRPQDDTLGVQHVNVSEGSLPGITGETDNSGQPQTDPYVSLAKNLHQAILDNVDQITLDIDIIGDPYYLVTSSMGNYRPIPNPDNTVGEGEAPFTSGDVNIFLSFRNPIDINEKNGQMMFDKNVTPYSGLFRLITVVSYFKDGKFTQSLKLIRLAAQIESRVDQASTELTPITDTIADPKNSPIINTGQRVSALRASPNSLAESIASGLPITGLPGQLSKLAGEKIGGLTGFLTGQTRVDNFAGQLAGGAGGPLEGLTDMGSVMRLAQSGLSALSSNINSAGASILQLTNTAESAGVDNSGQLSNMLVSSGAGLSSDFSQSSIDAIKSLGASSAGLMSEVLSKVDNLAGPSAALANQLGVDPSKLSGLSSDLQSQIIQQITDTVNNIPDNVNITIAENNGLIIKDIPIEDFVNIPKTQPSTIAPLAPTNFTDIVTILNQGGSLENLPGAFSIPGISSLLPANSIINLPTGSGLDSAAVADKLFTVQQGLKQLTGQAFSIESSLNNIELAVPSGLPNIADISSSVISKFGSNSDRTNSPLKILMENII
jgi:hypothetical protein